MNISITRYIIGIEVNGTIREISGKILTGYPGAITLPFPPIIPLFDSIERPAEPVPGLFPPCVHLSTSCCLEIAFPGPWLIWKVESNHWLEDLKTVFHSMGWVSGADSTLLPCLRGIPLAALEGEKDIEKVTINNYQSWPNENWKALKIVCLELRFSAEMVWYKALIWRKCWKRSLRGLRPAYPAS